MRGLAGALAGRRLRRVEQRRAELRFPLPERFAARLQGRRVEGFSRRAKYILAALDDGATWLSHLGMSGRMMLGEGPAPEPERHDHLIFETDDGQHLIYRDARRFGFMDLIEPGGLARPSSPCRPRHRAARTGADRPAAAGAVRRPARAAQGSPARPAAHRRARQHLCLRGAEPGPAPPRPAFRRPFGVGGARARQAPSGGRWKRRSQPAAPRCGTMCRPRASSAGSSTAGGFTGARAAHAPAVGRAPPSGAASSRAGPPSSARSARNSPAGP